MGRGQGAGTQWSTDAQERVCTCLGNLSQGVRKGLLKEVMFEPESELGRIRRTHPGELGRWEGGGGRGGAAGKGSMPRTQSLQPRRDSGRRASGQDPEGQLKDWDFFPIRSRTSFKALKNKKQALLRYNSHTIQVTYLQCTIQWFLLHSYICATIFIVNFKTLKKKLWTL